MEDMAAMEDRIATLEKQTVAKEGEDGENSINLPFIYSVTRIRRRNINDTTKRTN